MKTSSSLIVALALTFFVVGILSVHAQPYKPLSPGILFPVMPKEVTNWRLVSSKAQNVLVDWEMAVLTREFSRNAESDQENSNAPRIQEKTILTVKDTGGFAAFNQIFLNNPSTTTVLGFPALTTNIAGNAETLQIWVEKRFIVHVVTENQEPGAALEWMRKFDLSSLKELSTKGERELEKPLIKYRIDELNSNNSRYYKQDSTTDEQLQKLHAPQ